MRTLSRFLAVVIGCATLAVQVSAQSFFINHFDAAVTTSPTAAPNAWYTDRYAPASFEQFSFNGQNVLRHEISSSDALASRPAGYQATFYNTQGRKFDINVGSGASITADLYIPADWASAHRRADLWATGYNATPAVSAYPIIGFANMDGTHPTFRFYNSNDGSWTETPIAEFGKWYTLRIELSGSVINYYINDNFVGSYTPEAPATVSLRDMMLQGYNFADNSLAAGQYSTDSYDIYWDNVGPITGIHNATQDAFYMTLPAAVAAAQNGDAIELANGRYPITSTLSIGHGISITGKSEAGVIIDASAPSVTSWGINPKVSNVSLSNLTIVPNSVNGGYVIHAGDENVNPAAISNITLSHITIDHAYRSAFDFNGVDGLNVSYLTARNTTRGVGVAFSGCRNVAASHLATSGNAWGGVAVYVSPAVKRGSDNVVIDAASSAFAEPVKVYSQDEAGFVNTNISVPGFDYLVQNLSFRPGYTFYFGTASDALAFAAALTPAANTVVKQISTGMPVVGSQSTFSAINTPVLFGQANTILDFTTLPAGSNATITVTASATQPSNTPPPPANAGTVAPFYLDITTSGLVSPFSATITIDVSAIPDFTDGTIVMFYNNTTGTWLLLGSSGKYDAVAKTYTFKTDHFTTFSFVNASNPLHLYLTADNADVTKSIVYPHVGMGSSLVAADDGFNFTPGANDWTYKAPKVVLYVVPSGSQSIIAADFKVKFDPSKLTGLVVEQGNLLAGAFKADIGNGEVTINAANLGTNVAPAAGNYLAKLTFTMLVPGRADVTISDVDFRYYDDAKSQQQSVIVAPHSAAVRMYLGDFAKKDPDKSSIVGDGFIEFDDLTPFAAAYWQQQPAADYLSKFDIGPTNVNGSYFAMPKPDGKIEFEDLVIFAIGYGKSAANSLPKKQSVPAVFALGEREVSGAEVRVPVMVSGGVEDLRALSLVMNSSAKFVRVEKAGELNTQNGFVIAKQENGRIYVDAAVIGNENAGLSKEGIVAYVVLEGKGSVSLSEAKARNSRNGDLMTSAVTGGKSAVPESFSVSQNYPNPFNPSTMISYQLPNEAMVQIAVFNSLGQQVASLVNEVKGAGYYNVSWNAVGMPSGVYFYQIKAGDVNVSKKMLLMK